MLQEGSHWSGRLPGVAFLPSTASGRKQGRENRDASHTCQNRWKGRGQRERKQRQGIPYLHRGYTDANWIRTKARFCAVGPQDSSNREPYLGLLCRDDIWEATSCTIKTVWLIHQQHPCGPMESRAVHGQLAHVISASQKMHVRRSFLWGQLPASPHSRHLLFWRLCLHICNPPHSLHSPLIRLCSHICDPPHSTHWLLIRLCSHICDPPHSRHVLLIRSCSPSAIPHTPGTRSSGDYARISAIPHTLGPTLIDKLANLSSEPILRIRSIIAAFVPQSWRDYIV